MNADQLLKEIPTIKNGDYDFEKDCMIDVKPTAFVRDNHLFISGEDGKGLVDYYGEFRDGCPYIHPTLEKWAEDRGFYWEWENPGCIVLY